MLNILEFITNWIKSFLISCIMGNIDAMFGNVNTNINGIAEQIGKTPQEWNGGIFSMIQSLSDTVIIPIAGIILAFVLCYELISMLIEKNNMHDIDSWILFKWIIKAFIAVYLVTHSFDIVIMIFELSQQVVQRSAGTIDGNLAIDVVAIMGDMSAKLETMEVPELFLLFMESSLMYISMWIVALCIMLVLYGRMIEIFIYSSISPIPFATMINREWGGMGTNYLRGLLALGFQGFFIMVCVAIYGVLLQQITTAENIHVALWTCAGYTVMLCFSLFKTSSVSRSIFNAH